MFEVCVPLMLFLNPKNARRKFQLTHRTVTGRTFTRIPLRWRHHEIHVMWLTFVHADWLLRQREFLKLWVLQIEDIPPITQWAHANDRTWSALQQNKVKFQVGSRSIRIRWGEEISL